MDYTPFGDGEEGNIMGPLTSPLHEGQQKVIGCLAILGIGSRFNIMFRCGPGSCSHSWGNTGKYSPFSFEGSLQGQRRVFPEVDCDIHSVVREK